MGTGRRRRRWTDKLPPWIKEYAVEIGMGAAVAIAVFLLVEPWDLRGAILGWVTNTADALSAGLMDFSAMVINRLSLSDGIGAIILITVALTAGARLRWRMLHNPKYWNQNCPKCHSTELKRVHRRWYERLAGRLGWPIRRYRCSQCSWSGARIVKNYDS